MKLLTLIIFLIFGILCFYSCTDAPKQTLLDVSIPIKIKLPDQTHLTATLIFYVLTPEAQKEIKTKNRQILRAFNLILRNYKYNQLKSGGNSKIAKIAKRITDDLIKSKIDKIDISDYQLHSKP